MSALRHFRLPAISMNGLDYGNAIQIHHSLTKSPSPLPIHHSPLLSSFVFVANQGFNNPPTIIGYLMQHVQVCLLIFVFDSGSDERGGGDIRWKD